MQSKKSFSRVVIKVGSSLISSKCGSITLEYLKNITAQIARLLDESKEVILVSSGAVACGMSVLRLNKRPKDMAGLQASASIGQNELMALYRKLMGADKRICAQVLLTWEDFEDRARYLNVRHTLLYLIKNKILPIINENDTVSTDEIRFGDNDKLSALVANLVSADILIILSDVDGLYRLPKKEVIRVVSEITPEINRLCCSTDKETCVGGMSAKIAAVQIATGAGIPCVIANGRDKDSLLKAASGNDVGTLFLPKNSLIKAKKGWIAYGVRAKGALIVDDGAKNALINCNKSLLAVGVSAVKGNFKKNDTVSVLGTDMSEFARGKVNFSSKELDANKGSRLAREVIHKDNLVIL